MGCGDPRYTVLLERLLSQELTLEDFEALRAHAAGCTECRVQYERISQVESHQERRALPAARQALLEGALFARLGVESRPEAKVLRPRRWSVPRVVTWALPLAAALVLVVYLGPGSRSQQVDEFQPRGGGSEAGFGIRAFCVDAQAQVVDAARPGQTVRCAPGQSLQFSHTSAQPATLRIVGAGDEPLTFFPSEGGSAQVAAGVDVPLPFSTPVTDWLDRPLPVTATFLDQAGNVLGESRLVVAPAGTQ